MEGTQHLNTHSTKRLVHGNKHTTDQYNFIKTIHISTQLATPMHLSLQMSWSQVVPSPQYVLGLHCGCLGMIWCQAMSMFSVFIKALSADAPAHSSARPWAWKVSEWVSEWLNLTAFLGTVDSEVHLVHMSRVITAYTLQSLSSLT